MNMLYLFIFKLRSARLLDENAPTAPHNYNRTTQMHQVFTCKASHLLIARKHSAVCVVTVIASYVVMQSHKVESYLNIVSRDIAKNMNRVRLPFPGCEVRIPEKPNKMLHTVGVTVNIFIKLVVIREVRTVCKKL